MSFENTVFKKISFSIQMISEKNLIDSCEKDQCFVHGSVRVRSLYILGLGCDHIGLFLTGLGNKFYHLSRLNS